MCEEEQRKYFNDWSQSLVEWVNCLDLTKPVGTFAELKDGEFVKIILELILMMTIPEENILIKIKEFLRLNYPNCSIDYSATSIKELSDDNYMLILSLLLHFTCIIDGRIIFTNPLCCKLSNKIQCSVKCFLEQSHVDMTSYKLREEIMKAALTKPFTYTSEYEEINESHGQDLQDNSQINLIQQENARLKQELLMEKDKMEDLEMDLAQYKNEIKKMHDQLYEKSVTISNLCKEVSDFENQTPPMRSRNSSESEKHLKLELVESQQLTKELQKEQEKLQNEYTLINNKLQKSEEQCLFWRKEAIVNEHELETMLEKQKAQDEELECLRKNCNELSAFIEEIRLAKLSDDQALDDKILSQNDSYENLGTTVVDILLKDSQHEIEKLQKSLSESEQKNQQLQMDLSKLNEDCKDLSNNYKSVQKVNKILKNEILHLKESKIQLVNKNASLHQNVTKLTENNLLLKEESKCFQNKLSEIIESIDKCAEDVTVAQDCSKVLKEQNNLLNLQLKSATEEKDNLQRQLEVEHERYNELEENSLIQCSKLEMEIQELKKSVANLERDCKDKDAIISKISEDLQKEIEANNEIKIKKKHCIVS